MSVPPPNLHLRSQVSHQANLNLLPANPAPAANPAVPVPAVNQVQVLRKAVKAKDL